jgi:hypothetical protein
MTFEPQTFQLLASNALADPPAPERASKTWALELEPVLARDRAKLHAESRIRFHLRMMLRRFEILVGRMAARLES